MQGLTQQLTDFAALQFSMTVKEGDAGTRRDHLEIAAKSGSAAAQAELDAAAAADPGPARHVWDWFLELHAARGGSGFGPSPITYMDIAAWAFLTKRRPQQWEIVAIRRLDQSYLEASVRADSERGEQRQGAAR